MDLERAGYAGQQPLPDLVRQPAESTTLSVSGTAVGTDIVDIVCYSGAAPTVTKLASSVAVHNGTFTTGAVPLKPIAGTACRLRAVPAGGEAGNDNSDFAGPQVAVSEAAIPVSAIAGGPNANLAYNFYVNDVTFTGWAAWAAAGAILEGSSRLRWPVCGADGSGLRHRELRD